MEHPAVTTFRDYLRIKTVQPNPDYDGAIKFLRNIGSDLGLDIAVIQVTEKRPLLRMTWVGTQPDLPSLILSSHMDVVPVDAEHWDYDPFEAVKLENGDIIARGTQDMKCVTIQYMEAIRRLQNDGYRPRRSIHLLFTPDEEIGSVNGVVEFVKMKEFRDLNIGCVIDEGLASPSNQFLVYNGQKTKQNLKITIHGTPGHGSAVLENTVDDKLRLVLDKLLDFRNKEKSKWIEGEADIGDVVTLNVTILKGGVMVNVVPSEASICIDVRIPLSFTPEWFRSFMDDVCTSAGQGVSWQYLFEAKRVAPSPIDENCLWWKAFKSALDTLKLSYKVGTFQAGTDSNFIRALGIPAYGFSPMNNTPVLLHAHNEYLNEGVFLRGIDIYKSIISNMGDIQEF